MTCFLMLPLGTQVHKYNGTHLHYVVLGLQFYELLCNTSEWKGSVIMGHKTIPMYKPTYVILKILMYKSIGSQADDDVI